MTVAHAISNRTISLSRRESMQDRFLQPARAMSEHPLLSQFVATRRQGQRIYYCIADPRIPAILDLAELSLAEHAEWVHSCGVPSRSERR